MLRDNLYHIQGCTVRDDGFSFEVALEPDSVIYKAHFPGHPITPGVCLVQTAVELLGIHMEAEYKLAGSQNIKFTSPVVPVSGKLYTFTFCSIRYEDKGLSAKVLVESADVVHAKMMLSLIQ